MRNSATNVKFVRVQSCACNRRKSRTNGSLRTTRIRRFADPANKSTWARSAFRLKVHGSGGHIKRREGGTRRLPHEIFTRAHRTPSLLVLVCIRRHRAMYRREGAYFRRSECSTPWLVEKGRRRGSKRNDDVNGEEEETEEVLTVGLREASLRSLGPGVYAMR